MNTTKPSLLLVLFSAILLLSASCKNGADKEKNEAIVEEEETSRGLFSIGEFLTPSHANTFEEDLSGDLIVLTEEEFILKVTDIDNLKGFQYKGKTPCIVDFYADWCGPCMRMNPVLIELAEEYKGKVIFYKLNTDKVGTITRVFEINYLPTFLLFKRHAMPVKMEGGQLKEDLKKAIDEILLSEND